LLEFVYQYLIPNFDLLISLKIFDIILK
jgi:hypothetical protein